jgi:PAS domain S-box-containing protein
MMRICCFITIIFLVLLVQPLVAAMPKETKRVLIVYSQDKWHPAHELTERGMRVVFDSNSTYTVQLSAEYLDLGLYSGPTHARAMADFLRRKYKETKFDVIVAVYEGAMDFLSGEGRRLFPGVPIVACAISREYAEKLEGSTLRRFVTGAIMGDNITGVLNEILRLKPRTGKFALVAGTSIDDKYCEQLFRRGLKSFRREFDLIDLTGLSMEEIVRRASSLPPDTIVLYSSIVRDGDGKSFVPRNALTLITKASSAPVFGLFDSYMGFGIIGGPLASFELNGRETARLALRVMMGESPSAIPFRAEESLLHAYDWRELKRWGIPETAIPDGTEIRYRVPTFWEAHWWAVIGTATLLIIETTLILWLLMNVRGRRRAEQGLRESEAQVRLALSSAGAGLLSMNLEGGEIWVTERTRELFGFSKDEPLTFDKLLQVVHPEDRDVFLHGHEAGGDTYCECRLELPDGAMRWVAVRGCVSCLTAGSAQALMGVCVDITESKHAEETLRQHQQELVTLAGRLIHNQEEELRRLSRELHDDLTQRLAVLAIDAGMLEKKVHLLQPKAAAELKALKNMLIDVSNEVHQLSRRLHPSVLDDLGLVQAAQAECDTFRSRTGIDLSFVAGEITAPLSDEVALCLYRVMQEALQNMARHSRASVAHITIEERHDGIHLLIQDFGVGFDVEQAVGSPGIGLSSMRERVRLANGVLTIESLQGEGTWIEVFIPRGETTYVKTAGTDSR